VALRRGREASDVGLPLCNGRVDSDAGQLTAGGVADLRKGKVRPCRLTPRRAGRLRGGVNARQVFDVLGLTKVTGCRFLPSQPASSTTPADLLRHCHHGVLL